MRITRRRSGSPPVRLCVKPAEMKPSALLTLTVCGLDELEGPRAASPTSYPFLTRNGQIPAAFSAFDRRRRATLRFHDAIEPAPGVVLPQKAHVEEILAFGRDIGDDVAHLLIHCHAGVSRSTAAMAMILAQAFPHDKEDVIVDRLMRIRPQSWPNSRMIAFADELLGRDGRLNVAVARIYARHLAKRPELSEIMRQANRGKEVELGLRRKG